MNGGTSLRGTFHQQTVCCVCLRDFSDPRLLDCLHSLCRDCIDQTAVTANKQGNIDCPVCRCVTRLPENGASGLPRDITRATDSGPAPCVECEKEGKRDSSSVAWCVGCEVALCTSHIGTHFMSLSVTGSHNIQELPEKAAPVTSPGTICAQHKKRLDYFCVPCTVFVCGDCLAFGEHRGHQPVRPAVELVLDQKKKIQELVNKLNSVTSRQLGTSLAAINDVSAELCDRAKTVRSEIEAAGERAVHLVQACVHQALQEVEDIELGRCKVLDRQTDELKRDQAACQNAVAFGNRLLNQDSRSSGIRELLSAAEKRMTAVCNIKPQEPLETARLSFSAVDSESLLSKAEAMLGEVLPAKVSAKHCTIVGSTVKETLLEEEVTFTVQLRDREGRTNRYGRAVVHATVTCVSTLEVSALPRVTTADEGGGRHSVKFTPNDELEYKIDVFVNDERLAQQLSVTCHAPEWGFDPRECQAGNAVSPDQRSVSHNGRCQWSSVLGSRSFRRGCHGWRVKMAAKKDTFLSFFLGVSPQRGLPPGESWKKTYSWNSYYRTRWSTASGVESPMRTPWKPGDTIELQLDCEARTLQITNTRTGESDRIVNLPDTEFFPYFALHFPEDLLCLV